MAAPSYTEDLTDIALMESGQTGAAALNISGGGGGAPAFGADFGMQGAGCWDKAASNAERAILVNIAPGAGAVAAGVHIFQWGFVGTPGILDTEINRGVYVIGGTASTAYVQYHVDGLDTLGAQGRVGKCFPYRYVTTSQLDRVPFRTVTGSPGATPDEWGYGIHTTATAKSTNFGMDAVRYGTGAYLTAGELLSAGDASDDPASFVGFNVQNDQVDNRWGILTGVGGTNFELQGRFVIGQNSSKTATACSFKDNGVNITLVDTVHCESDFTQIILDHASTWVEWDNVSITALGAINPGQIQVNSANPEFQWTGGAVTDIGIMTFRSNSTVSGVTFRACGEISCLTATMANSSIVQASAIIDAQDETSYDNSPTTEGSFVGGTTGHVAGDVLILDDGTVIDVDLVSSGVVTQFTIDSTRSFRRGGVRTMVSTDGAGDAFTLTPDTDNYTNSAGLSWTDAADPNGELDNMTFDTLTSAMGHAIEFGASAPLTMTLTGIDFGTNFSATTDGSVGNETFRFLRTTGTITLNLVNCTGNFGYQKEAGATVVISASVQVNVAGLTWGTPVKLIARETLGAVTDGDTLATGFADSTGVFQYAHNDQGSLDISVVARNQGVCIAAIANNFGTGFVNETDEAHSNTTADMTLLPAVPDVDDAYYFGHDEMFAGLKLDISTALGQSAAPDLIWEYYNGTIWASLTGVVDDTNGLETAGENKATWTIPGNWTATVVTGETGSLFYVRIRVDAVGTITTTPVGRKVALDVSRYFPYDENREIVTGVGLQDNASWILDKISTF